MSFLVALSFLTRVPLGSWGARAWAALEQEAGHSLPTPTPTPAGPLARSAGWFPVVGGLVGALIGTAAALTEPALGSLVAACLGVVVGVLVTGALHLDGLADCADGCGGGDREARLRIMKDHSVGVYGAAAVVLDLLLSVALLERLVVDLSGTQVVLALAAVHAVSRSALLPLARALPYARETGTGAMLIAGLGWGRVALALVVAGSCVIGLIWAAGHALAGPAVLVAGVMGALAAALWARRSLGGVTGDVLGACVEATTLAGMVGLLLVI